MVVLGLLTHRFGLKSLDTNYLCSKLLLLQGFIQTQFLKLESDRGDWQLVFKIDYRSLLSVGLRGIMKEKLILSTIFAVSLLIAGCNADNSAPKEGTPTLKTIDNKDGNTKGADTNKKIAKLTIQSAAFNNNDPIPVEFSCDGKDSSPPLKWQDVPAEAKSLALICDDPDAPGNVWVHWVTYNIAPKVSELSASLATTEELKDIGKQGINDFQKVGYGGPCPPPGNAHHYYFKLYALDKVLELPTKPTKAQLEAAMKDHIIAQGELIGTYKK